MSSLNYVIFCRLAELDKLDAQHQAGAFGVLAQVCEERVASINDAWHQSSVYGRFVVVPDSSTEALNLSKSILEEATKQGVRLNFGLACGATNSLQVIGDLNWAGTAINLAARLASKASKQRTRGKIAIDVDVVRDACQLGGYHKKQFTKITNDTEKRTQLKFQFLRERPPALGSRPVSDVSASGTWPVVVVDIARYSDKKINEQVQVAETLGHCAENSFNFCGAIKNRDVFHAPAGDGGAFAFNSRIEASWTFATRLLEAASPTLEVRIGLAIDPVVILNNDYPLGPAVFVADEVSSFPDNNHIACTSRYWKLLCETNAATGWTAKPVDPNRKDSPLLLFYEDAPPPGVDDRTEKYRQEIKNCLVGFFDTKRREEIGKIAGAEVGSGIDAFSVRISTKLVKQTGFGIDQHIGDLLNLRKVWAEKAFPDVSRLDDLIDWLLPVRFDETTRNQIEAQFKNREAIIRGAATRAGSAIVMAWIASGTDLVRKKDGVVAPKFREYSKQGGGRAITGANELMFHKAPPDDPDSDVLLMLQDLASQIDLDPDLYPSNDLDHDSKVKELAKRIKNALKVQLSFEKRLHYCFVKLVDRNENETKFQEQENLLSTVQEGVEYLVFITLNSKATTSDDENELTQMLLTRFKTDKNS